MPLLQDEQRKQDFLNDMGSMFSGNSTFKQGKKEVPDYTKAFTDVTNYFGKSKDDLSRRLMGFAGNFLNVYNSYKNYISSGGDPNNSITNTMLNDIRAMKTEFKKDFDAYIKENKYTALKNKNVKMLSAMVQVAENMGHRLEVEERVESINEVVLNRDLEQTTRTTIQEKYKAYILKYKNDKDVDYVDTEFKKKQAEENLKAKQTLLNNLLENKKQYTNSDNSKEMQEVETYTQQLLDLKEKKQKAEQRRNDLNELQQDIKYLQKLNEDSQNKISIYQNHIDTNDAYIKETDREIDEESRKVREGELARKRREQLQKDPYIVGYNKLFDDYEPFETAYSYLTDMAEMNLNINALKGGTKLSAADIETLNVYEQSKKTICDAMPELKDKFAGMEASPDMTMTDFIYENNDALEKKYNEYLTKIDSYNGNATFEEYKNLKQQITIGESSRNTVKGLEEKKIQLQQEKTKYEAQIASTKLQDPGFARRIKNTSVKIPEGPITNKQLTTLIFDEYIKSKEELADIEKNDNSKEISEKLKEAQERADKKDPNNINTKITAAKAEVKKAEDILEKQTNAHREATEISSMSNSLLDNRKAILDRSPKYKNINPNQEIYDRLQGIVERFKTKSNGKLNPECQDMMNKLDDAIEAFDPNVEEHKHDQQEALTELYTYAGRYIDKKMGQHIPTWIASEQRLLRLSCAEEMQNFSLTAQKIISDVKKQKDYGSASIYVDPERCNERAKERAVENYMESAANVARDRARYHTLLNAKNTRETTMAPKQIENPTLNMNAPK